MAPFSLREDFFDGFDQPIAFAHVPRISLERRELADVVVEICPVCVRELFR